MIYPNRFKNDPIGHVTNQVGHAAIGFAGVYLLGSPVFILIAYFLLVEIPQIVRFRDQWVLLDSIEDALHVAIGVIVAAGFLWVLAVWPVILAVGAWRRS